MRVTTSPTVCAKKAHLTLTHAQARASLVIEGCANG